MWFLITMVFSFIWILVIQGNSMTCLYYNGPSFIKIITNSLFTHDYFEYFLNDIGYLKEDTFIMHMIGRCGVILITDQPIIINIIKCMSQNGIRNRKNKMQVEQLMKSFDVRKHNTQLCSKLQCF